MSEVISSRKSQLKCCIPGCPSTYTEDPTLGFSRFPKSKSSEWCDEIKRKFPNYQHRPSHYICHLHFSDKNFPDTLRSRLSTYAFPDILESHEADQSYEIQSSDEVSQLHSPESSELVDFNGSIPITEHSYVIQSPDDVSLLHFPKSSELVDFNSSIPIPDHLSQSIEANDPYPSLQTFSPRLDNDTSATSGLSPQRSETPEAENHSPLIGHSPQRSETPEAKNSSPIIGHSPQKSGSFVSEVYPQNINTLETRIPLSKFNSDKTTLLNTTNNQNSTKKYMKDLKSYQTVEALFHTDKDNLRRHFTESSWQFFKSQFANIEKTKDKGRWTLDDKVFALSIITMKSPKTCYRFFNSVFKFPDKTILRTMLDRIPFDTGFNSLIFNYLAAVVTDMSPKDRNCCLMFDDMPLSYGFNYTFSLSKFVGYEDLGCLGRNSFPANRALVFTVSGVETFWRQPICYFFIKDRVEPADLKSLIVQVIIELQKIGLNVLYCVTNQSKSKVSALKQLVNECESERTGKCFLINNKKITWIHYPSSLLKSTNHSLFKYNIQFHDGKIAKWEHIVDAYSLDKQHKCPLLKHLQPEWLLLGDTKFKLKVNVAAKIFSQKTAGPLEFFARYRILPPDVDCTSEFLLILNKLFVSLNSANRHSITPTSEYVQFWRSTLKKIKSWKCLDNQGNVCNSSRFIEDWVSTIEGTLVICEMFRKLGYNHLRTKCLNPNSLDGLFGMIRKKSQKRKPSPFEFMCAFKSCVLNSLFKLKLPTSKYIPCVKSLLNNTKVPPVLSFPEEENELIFSVPYVPSSSQPDSKQDQGEAYVCRLFMKHVRSMKCKVCIFSLEITSTHSFASLTENFYDNPGLIVTSNVSKTIVHIHKIMFEYLEKYGHFVRIRQQLLQHLMKVLPFDWYHCDSHRNSVKLKLLTISLNKFQKQFYRKKLQALQNDLHAAISRTKIIF